MIQEDKELLLKELCARLPYGVICRWECDGFSDEGELTDICRQKTNADFKYWDGFLNFDGEDIPVELLKPYLRPMSSMTEEEKKEYRKVCELDTEILSKHPMDDTPFPALYNSQDWLIANHFDYRGLIPMDLAIEAPEGMYK